MWDIERNIPEHLDNEVEVERVMPLRRSKLIGDFEPLASGSRVLDIDHNPYVFHLPKERDKITMRESNTSLLIFTTYDHMISAN